MEQRALLPDVGPMEPTPAQISSASRDVLVDLHRRWFDGSAEDVSADAGGWLAVWQLLHEEQGYDWRKAALIAWSAWPDVSRYPQTQQELARMLGLTSDRVFYSWRQKDPTIDEEIRVIWKRLVADEIRDVDRVSLAVAKLVDYKSTAERRLLYQRYGVLDQDGAVTVNIGLDNIRNLSTEELLKLATSLPGDLTPGPFPEGKGSERIGSVQDDVVRAHDDVRLKAHPTDGDAGADLDDEGGVDG